MPCLRLLAIEEKVPREAFISLAAVAALRLLSPGRPPVAWSGTASDCAAATSSCTRPKTGFSNRTTGAARWGLISIAPKDLAHYGRTLLGAELTPGVTRLLRPTARSASDLLRLHAQAGRLARAKPELLGRPEVVGPSSRSWSERWSRRWARPDSSAESA